jgi:putative protease
MKTALYVAAMARTYRRAIDDYFISEECYRENLSWYREEIGKCTYRQYTTGFFFGKPGADAQIYDNSVYVKDYTYLGLVHGVEDGICRMEQRNRFFVGDKVEVMKPSGENQKVTVLGISDLEGNAMESCPHPKQKIFVRFDRELEVFDLVRQKKEEKEGK